MCTSLPLVVSAKPLAVRVPWRALVAGGLAGATGVLGFAAAHAWLIVPIWTRLAGGLPLGILAGGTLAWGLVELRWAGRCAGVAGGLGYGALLWLALAPHTGLVAAVEAAGLREAFAAWEVPAVCALAISAGAALGRTLARTRRAALALAAAVLSLALAMGGPVRVLHTPTAARLFLAFLPICAAAGLGAAVALGRGGRGLSRRRGPGSPS
jgi:hypothetical protein